MDNKRNKQAIVKTHIDKIIAKTWAAFLYSNIILLITIFASVYIFDAWIFTVLITPTILVMTGLAQYVTGYASRFVPFIRGAYVFWLGALLCILSHLVVQRIDTQFAILAVCMIVGFVIPGHVLNRKAKENV